ncbi:MAG TPA: GNAT family N-acetyltransferase [Candidatus Dormibacteraeota bacterium]|nr:GNAT family N-acetyltransferase [Candidatus Dormibacteraeota bacterium]
MSSAGAVRLVTPRLVVRTPLLSDGARLLAYVTRNRPRFVPWDPTPPEGYFTESFWVERCEYIQFEIAEGRALSLVMTDRADLSGALAGRINFTAIERGVFDACRLGYSVDGAYEGRGLMREALEAAIAYVFDDLGLHRIMANYQPTNERSGNLLRRLNFAVEGYARDYLFINGAWRDHVLTARINPRHLPPP